VNKQTSAGQERSLADHNLPSSVHQSLSLEGKGGGERGKRGKGGEKKYT